MERYVRLVEPVLRGPVVIVIAIGAFVAAGAIGGRFGVALASAFVAFHASYCVLNFWLCRETHCVVTGAGWALLAVLGFAAALVPGASLSWYRANVVTIGYLVVLGLGYLFEWAVAARTGRRALARSGPEITPTTPQPEPVRMVTESNAGGIDDRPPLLHGRSVALRPLKPADVERVAQIQAQPAVLRWWGPPDLEDLRRKADGSADEKAFVIETDGEPIGLIEYHEENEPDFRHAGIDLYLADDHQGRGLGTDAIRTLARYLIEGRGHHRLTIDPAADNRPAIRAYQKVGFRPVGILRQYWRAPDGTWHDGLLMDLLAPELEQGSEATSSG